jgi:hypothetical protein
MLRVTTTVVGKDRPFAALPRRMTILSVAMAFLFSIPRIPFRQLSGQFCAPRIAAVASPALIRRLPPTLLNALIALLLRARDRALDAIRP